jgi:hypothetical protein
MRCSIPETDRDNSRQWSAKFCDIRTSSCARSTKQERYMYDAMHAVSHGVVPEISKGSSAEGDEDYATPKGRFLRRAALRITWLLVLVLRNTSTSTTPLDLMHSGDRMAVSRLVTEGDCLTSEQNPKFVCRVPAFTSRGPCLRVSHSYSADQPDCRRVQTLFSMSRLEEKSSSRRRAGGRNCVAQRINCEASNAQR